MPAAKITVLPDEPIGVIRPELYGHFAEHLGGCVDGGLWVGEDSPIPNYGGLRADAIEALRRLNPPVLRWPGGCFADDYHWQHGVGPRRERPRTVNLWWGQTVENNHFGTHEFLNLCGFLGAKPYLAGNVGSGTPAELRDWVEYCNFAGDSTLARRRAANGSPRPFGVRYWGVGNENWNCGGSFCPEDYAAEYRRFATYLRDFSGTELFLIACGPDGNDLDWTRRFFTKLGRKFSRIHGYAAHYYCGTAGPSATEYSVDEWYELLAKAAAIETLIVQQRETMDRFDPKRRVSLVIDEWGTWHLPTPGRNPAFLWQQNTLRDALVAAITLDAFNRHCDKLAMCNVAQVANVLQAMILTEGEKLVLTPTYHVFDLYQHHQGGHAVRAEFDAPPVRFAAGEQRGELAGLSGSASVRDGLLTLSVVNPHATLPAECSIDLRGRAVGDVEVATLTHDDIAAHNTFDSPDVLRPTSRRVESPGAALTHLLPSASVTVFRTRLVS
ncbi:MAG TPA: alpha-L-arabinofuranosidase C-terminal domain-containing protein [Tepidisphaeraceae bacterium]|nr:alpha-L-arabinofuranosidase C-terminal domain-containing protein [Tepidisphaeraceae bacterium]